MKRLMERIGGKFGFFLPCLLFFVFLPPACGDGLENEKETGNGEEQRGDKACERLITCCESVSGSYCLLKGEPEQILELCKLELNGEIKNIFLSEPAICKEWAKLQVDFIKCLGRDDYDCDDFIGANAVDGYDDICQDKCEELWKFKRSRYIENCRSAVEVDTYGKECRVF